MLPRNQSPHLLKRYYNTTSNTRTYVQNGLFVLLLFILLGLKAPQSAQAQNKVFVWERFDVDITLLENGDLLVEETQTLNFSGGTFSFGFGTIPTGTNGNNDGIVDISVREGDVIYSESRSQAPRTFSVDRRSDEVRIDWYFEPTVGEHTYTFSYRVVGGVIVGTLEEGSGDQVFWKAIPADHPAAIKRSRVTIRLPEGVEPQKYFDTNDYLVAGYIDGTESDTVLIDVGNNGRVITYETTQTLPVGQAFEVRVQFPHGVLPIEVSDWQVRQERGDTIDTGLLFISLLLLVLGPLGVLALWFVRGRDPQLLVTVPDYITEPPNQLPPAVLGTLVDEKADMHDILSILVDLARRGYLIIDESDKKDHKFIRTDKSADHGLRPFEQAFLSSLFGRRESRTLKSMKYEFASDLPELRKKLYEELEEQGLTPHSLEGVRNNYGCLGFLMIAVGFILFIMLNGIFANSEVGLISCPGIIIGLTGVTLLFTARYMPAKTAKGVEAAAMAEAFRKYLRSIEKHEDLAEAGEIFEKYLAYAVAFGIERSWIRKFSAVATTPIPGWYHMPGHRPYYGGSSRPTGAGGVGGTTPSLEGMSGNLTGGLAGMSSSFTRMLTSTSTTMKSVRSSSSSGGSSGGFSGGFSGGGFSSGGGGSRGFG